MGSVLAAAFVAAALLGDVGVEASVRAGTRMRVAVERQGGSEAGEAAPSPGTQGLEVERRTSELDLSPVVAVTSDARLRARLSYEPRLLTAFESARVGLQPGAPVNQVQRTSILHGLSLGLERELGRWDLRGAGRAVYGEMDPVVDAATVQPLAVTRRLPYEEFRFAGGFSWSAFSASTLSLDASASFGGGLGTDAAAILPPQREYRSNAGVDHEVSELTRLGASLSWSDSRVVGVGDATILRAGGSVTHLVSRPTTLRLAGGITAAVDEQAIPPLGGERRQVAGVGPWGEASFAYDAGEGRPVLTASLGAEPTFDRYRGTLDQRVSLSATVSWDLLQDWRAGLSGTAALLAPWLGYQEGQDESPTWLGTAEARLAYLLSRDVSLAGAVSSTWQESGRLDLLSYSEVAARVELVASLPR